jgi:hypothetical protein
MLPKRFFCQNEYISISVGKSSPKFGLILQYRKYLQKVSNRPLGENSSIPVTQVSWHIVTLAN